jgi:hypothetical protein
MGDEKKFDWSKPHDRVLEHHSDGGYQDQIPYGPEVWAALHDLHDRVKRLEVGGQVVLDASYCTQEEVRQAHLRGQPVKGFVGSKLSKKGEALLADSLRDTITELRDLQARVAQFVEWIRAWSRLGARSTMDSMTWCHVEQIDAKLRELDLLPNKPDKPNKED